MVTLSTQSHIKEMFGHLPEEDFKLVEELWLLKDKLMETKGWWARYKIKSSIKELEKEVFFIGMNDALNKLIK